MSQNRDLGHPGTPGQILSETQGRVIAFPGLRIETWGTQVGAD